MDKREMDQLEWDSPWVGKRQERLRIGFAIGFAMGALFVSIIWAFA